MKRLSRLALAATAVALVIPMSGCAALLSAQQTHTYKYNGGDGAWTTIDDVDVRGLLLIENNNDEAQFFYHVNNNSLEPAQVEISVGSADETFRVDAGETVVQNPENENSRSAEPLVVTDYGGSAGSQVDVVVTVNGTSEVVRTQVLNGALPEYEQREPKSTVPEETPSAEATTEDAHAEESAEAGH